MLLALVILLWLLLQTSFVQTWLVNKIASNLSKELNTTISIKKVDFSFFDNLHLQGVLVNDQQKDSLLYAGEIKVSLTDWFFLKDKIVIHQFALSNAKIHLKRTGPKWNYQFLSDYFSGGTSDSTKKAIELAVEKVELDQIQFFQEDKWRGEDQHIALSHLQLNADLFDLKKKSIHISSINLKQPYFGIENYDGNRPDSLRPKDIPFTGKNDSNHLRWNPGKWSIKIDGLTIQEGRFTSDIRGYEPYSEGFDPNHIEFKKIQGQFKNIVLVNDSIKAKVAMSTYEKGGLDVRTLNANIRFHPEAMEFRQLDLRTPQTRLHDYFAMKYKTFDDLAYFVSRVTMEGDFNKSVLHSSDIAHFAPALKSWNTHITIDGKIKGTVENLSAKNLVITAGNNTYLNGDIKLNGLPDINSTFIDFDANEFRTTYLDAVTLLPVIKTIQQPRLDLLQYIRFKGNFSGFINNFVTYGAIETNLGTLVSDLNMKFPAKANTIYKGTLQTSNFDLGTFIDVPQLSSIAFKGKVNGSGIQLKTINAELDGEVSSLSFNSYDYKNIKINGTVSQKLFNGRFSSDDPNFKANLDGLIDFSKAIPRFDFEASIANIDLRKTNITPNDIQFSGNFRFDFTGNNIDNFLGTAKVYDASLYHKGLRLPFDSLVMESSVIENNKSITVLSNEFDAALAGEFSILALPDAFQTFLNKYYPSYIKPSKAALKNENFSFVISTKNVQDYLNIFPYELKGFNYSTFTGRINDKENLLDLNAEVPQFSYKNISFYDLNLKGAGTLSDLSVETKIGDVYINDSLHFPGTSLNIDSRNDTSLVKIITSANQTLNAANLSAQVVTKPRGVSILFNESNFDINGKSWVIDKNGLLVLTPDLVEAEKVRIYNGQQSISITTEPSDIGNTNDIKIDLQKINIGDFSPYFIRSNRLEGLLSANVAVADPFGNLHVDMDGDVEQFRLDDDSVGNIVLSSNYNKKQKKVNFKGISDNQNYRFDVSGFYQIADSAGKDNLDLLADVKRTKVDLLEQYLVDVFSKVRGNAYGQLRIVGPTNALKYIGEATMENDTLTVGYTNVSYIVPKANVIFKDDRIDFGSFYIKDSLGNTGQLSKGVLRHESFGDMDFDFSLNTGKLLVLNTSKRTDEAYYGKVIAKANMTLTGPVDNMVMNIKGQPADSSSFFIRSEYGKESGQADFIVWKTYGKEMQERETSRKSKLTINLDISANNYAKMNVIMDELTNDIMSTIGHGNLRMRASTTGEFSLTGQYDIDRGDYNFNFQTLFRKPFKLVPDAGSYIRWNGDPFDADMKVAAEYEADNVKFSDLGDRLYLQTGGDIDYIKKYRGKVKVLANLSGKLMEPAIKFNLEMPQNSPLKNDPLVINLLRQIQNDENELNKQVAFLIIFNSFGPLSSSSQSGLGGQAVEGIVTGSISSFISAALNKQFSSIVQKVFNDPSIKVNFNAQVYNGAYLLNNNAGGFNLDRTNLNLSLAKSLFNERLTFTFGSALDFGITATQARSTTMQFLPDIAAEWKLRPDGKLLLTFFYRDSYNYQSANGKQNRSGAGISYRKDFEQFSDLWKGEKKKKKKSSPPANEDSTVNKAAPVTTRREDDEQPEEF
ncbi:MULTISPECIES: translocation/assembly module TamB domain-containing protein [unclassified Paraflavitalea]|uniref:translocation/assembly module TamB domain-containing protein n=1 Tax=unclassified Paraflavitalea TaxID=2798305 RepID=UPI003D34D342